MMCWAACDRLGKIATRLEIEERARYWRDHAARIHAGICEQAWNAERNSFAESFGGEDLDASLLLIELLGFLPPTITEPRSWTIRASSAPSPPSRKSCA